MNEEEKNLVKKKGLGIERNNEEAMDDGSSAVEGRGPMLTDIGSSHEESGTPYKEYGYGWIIYF